MSHTNTPAPFTFYLRALCVLALLAALRHTAHAQGCAQCLDNTRATPPAVQAAYRHAIALLAGSAATFFTAGVLLLRRVRRSPKPAPSGTET